VSVATLAKLREKKLRDLEERKERLEAELDRPSEAAREIAELEEQIRAASYSYENAAATADREFSDARAEYEQARDALLSMLPEFIDAMERAQRARVQVDAKARVSGWDRPRPIPIDRPLLNRWRKAVAQGFAL
jgi:molecular chaperone GrpE (heat shock protein)